MSYCLNPDCQKAASNPKQAKFCQTCGSKLLLQDRYRALKLIGQGGFGRTFLAVDESQSSKPQCVIKQFFPQAPGIPNTQKSAELFEQEAVRLEEFGKHPQIPQFLDHFEQDNHQYLVQEFIDGLNLAQILETENSFSETQIRDILNSLLPVIQFIHDRNVIHRDIKPENIIRRNDGQLILVDFGAAKYATGTALARTGTVIGSAGYAAPEQAGGKAVFSSDIYSLGITCLHLLTKTEPFDLYSFSEATWVWRDYLRHPVSQQLSYILNKMVEMATSRRYQSATEVLHDLNFSPDFDTKTPKVIPAKSTVQFPQSIPFGATSASQLPLQTWRCVYTLEGHTSSIRSLAISPDGQILASSSDDKTVKLWQLTTGRELLTLKGHSKPVYAVTFSPDNQILASGSEDKTIKLWHWDTKQLLGTLTLGGWFSGDTGCVSRVAITPDAQTLVSLSSGDTIKLWQMKTGKEICTLTGHSSWIYAIAISPDGKMLVGGSDDRSIQRWDLKTGRRLRPLRGHNSWVYAVAFSPDGKLLASGSDDTTIKV
ncbi:MAG TPA: WD40 repeat domain-containing serine/threonine-protein kinase, partial [Cyanophyceae cyanobacterium]